MENWSKFEEIAKAIQTELSPNAIVTLNEVIKGKSGATNQCDITIRSKIGQIPFLAVIECKDHIKNIGVPIVREFASKINDTGAMKGIIVAAKGFTFNARAFAMHNNIDTYTLFDAQSIKWKDYALLPVAVIHVTLKNAKVHFMADEKEIEVTEDIQLIDKSKSEKINMRQYVENIWDEQFRFDETLKESCLTQEFTSEAYRWKVLFKDGKEIDVIIHASIGCYYTYFYGHTELAQGRGFQDVGQNKMLSKNFSSDPPLDFREIVEKWPSVKKVSDIPFTPSLWIRIIKHFRPMKRPYLPQRMRISMEKGQFVLDNIYNCGQSLSWHIPKKGNG